MEFKEQTPIGYAETEEKVLIESDWNLKGDRIKAYFLELKVLIESDWNLKRGVQLYSTVATWY